MYFKLKSVQSVFSVNYGPKQFQKQWKIELHDISLSSIPYSPIFPSSLPLPPGFANLISSAKRHHGQPAPVLRVVLKILTFCYFTYAIWIGNLLLLYPFWTLQTLRLVFSIGPVTPQQEPAKPVPHLPAAGQHCGDPAARVPGKIGTSATECQLLWLYKILTFLRWGSKKWLKRIYIYAYE